jgi:hypothetical protein
VPLSYKGLTWRMQALEIQHNVTSVPLPLQMCTYSYLKITVFWHMTPCSMTESSDISDSTPRGGLRYRYCERGVANKASRGKTTRRHIPEDRDLRIHRRENITSHTSFDFKRTGPNV